MGRSKSFLLAGASFALFGIAAAQDSSAPAPVQLPGVSQPSEPQAQPESTTPETAPSDTAQPESMPPGAPVPLGASDANSGAPESGAPQLRGSSGAPASSAPPPSTAPAGPAEEAPLDLGVKPPDPNAPADAGGEPGSAGVSSGDGSLIDNAEQRRALHPSWPAAVLRGLDKVTGRVSIVQAPINQPVKFGRLEIAAKYCYKRPPEEQPEVNAFLEITDTRAKDTKLARVFTGWMFASSPGLYGLEHPTYDVWLIDCKASTPEIDFGSAPKAPAPKELDAKQPPKR
ncbi:MAG: DUF2155 domain-containing protein [Alphaproteobacteria bacterium]